jgi:hypothetical protein
MNKRFFVDDVITDEGKYRVLQVDSQTKERFGVKDFETREEAQKTADDMQRAINKALAEVTTGELPDITSIGDNSEAHGNKFKDTLQDIKGENSQE